MAKKILAGLICFIWLIIFISAIHGQGSKKTITLPSGEVVWDLNGEWDVLIENYGDKAAYGSYPQIWKITQTESSFEGVRMIDDPRNKKGKEAIRGELDKSGFKNVELISRAGPITSKGKISDDGNKMEIDSAGQARATATRK
jgi:hypothetical protein